MGAGRGLLAFLFALPLLLVYWVAVGLWRLSGRVVGNDQTGLRVVLTALMFAGLASIGALLPGSTQSHPTVAGGVRSSATLTNYADARVRVTLLGFQPNVKVSDPVNPGGAYALVRWRIENVGSTIYEPSSDAPGADTAVISSHGTKNDGTPASPAPCDQSFSTSIAPGSVAEGCVVVDMSPGERGTKVRFQTDDGVGATSAEWVLPPATPATLAPRSPGAVAVSLPSVGLLWLKDDRHCHVPDYTDPITGAHCTPLGMQAGLRNGVLVNDPNCNESASMAALSGSKPTDPLADNLPCTAPPGLYG